MPVLVKRQAILVCDSVAEPFHCSLCSRVCEQKILTFFCIYVEFGRIQLYNFRAIIIAIWCFRAHILILVAGFHLIAIQFFRAQSVEEIHFTSHACIPNYIECVAVDSISYFYILNNSLFHRILNSSSSICTHTCARECAQSYTSIHFIFSFDAFKIFESCFLFWRHFFVSIIWTCAAEEEWNWILTLSLNLDIVVYFPDELQFGYLEFSTFTIRFVRRIVKHHFTFQSQTNIK